MKLGQLKAAGGSFVKDLPDGLAQDLERIFKWKTKVVKALIDEAQFLMLIPQDASPEMREFTLKMINKKLPHLVEDAMGKGWSLMELRLKVPNLASVTLNDQSLQRMLSSFEKVYLQITLQKLD